ncbi:MAG: hypothetical protein KGL46_13820 [Hyphomicrobiales bacterium]|nr:hypothetical protein [Hyphomicrobiales bacterium]
MMRVAAAQISSGPDVGENLASALAAVERAAAAGAQLVALPEAAMFWFGGPLAPIAEPLDGPYASALRAAARRLGVVIVAGMFEPAADGRVHNTLLATGPGVETFYRKIHLYDAFGARESDTVAPGDQYVHFNFDGVRIGLATCFDLRFARQFSALAHAGAQLIVAPASWGEGPGKTQQWDLVTRARAADSQCWLLACGQAWRQPQAPAPLGVGRSRIVDPLGEVRAQLSTAPDVLVYDVDLEMIADVRARLPLLDATL